MNDIDVVTKNATGQTKSERKRTKGRGKKERKRMNLR